MMIQIHPQMILTQVDLLQTPQNPKSITLGHLEIIWETIHKNFRTTFVRKLLKR